MLLGGIDGATGARRPAMVDDAAISWSFPAWM